MNNIERLRQYVGKASFSSESDRYSALECLAEIEKELFQVRIDDAQETARIELDNMVLRDK